MENLARFDKLVDLPERYRVQLDEVPHPSANGGTESYRLVLMYPDGREDLVWNPPGMQPDLAHAAVPGATKPVTSLRVLAANIANEVLAVMIVKDRTDYWWLRWEMQRKELLPLIVQYSRPREDRYRFLDPHTVEVDSVSRSRLFTLKADRDGNLTSNNAAWDRDYMVYKNSTAISHAAAEFGGEVQEIEGPNAWPFDSKEITRPRRLKVLVPSVLATPSAVASQQADQTTKSLENLARFDKPVNLPEGFNLRIEKAPSASNPNQIESFKLILRHPDGREDHVWNPPGMQPDLGLESPPGASKPVKSLHVLAAHLSNQMLGAIIWKDGDDYWWLRWDLRKKELLPQFVRYFRFDADRYRFIDANTVEVDSKGSRRLYQLKVGPNDTLFSNGVPWEKNYVVYKGNMEIGHAAAEYGGEVASSTDPNAWPFDAKQITRPRKRQVLVPSNLEPLKPKGAGAGAVLQGANPEELKGSALKPNSDAAPAEPKWMWIIVGVLAAAALVVAWKRRA